MWLDETITANVAKMPVTEIIKNFSIKDFHPPLHYLFLNFWVKIFGNSVIAMRLTSVIFSLITIWLIYKIGKEIKNEKTGLWAAIILGVNPLFVYFSQELRMYMMAVMWLNGAIYFFVKINKKPNWKNILGFNILIFLSFLTFYGSIFLIAAMILYWLVTKKFKLFFTNSIGIILAILVISPLLLIQLKNSGNMLTQVTNWRLVLGTVNLKNLLMIPLKFSVGKISWYPKIFYYGVSGIWTLIIFGLTIKESIKNKILGFLLIVPIILGIIFSFKSPLLDYFRFLYLIPILALLLAKIKSDKIKIKIAFGFLIFSLIYLIDPNMYREDWKSLATSLKTNQNIYMIGSFADPIKYYNPEIKVKDIKTTTPTEKEIIVIPYGEEIHGLNLDEKLIKLNYKKEQEKSFRGISLESWDSLN
jgi:uncharacterized membrane protein